MSDTNTATATGASGASNTANTSAWQSSSVKTQSSMGQDDFFKLLVAQMSSQDPMNPMKDTEFIGQLAQLNSMEQSKAVQQEVSAMRSDQRFFNATTMVGKDVTLISAKDAQPTTGKLTQVEMRGGSPQLVIGGQRYDMSKVYSISLASP